MSMAGFAKKDIAREFGVSSGTVSNIVYGKSWVHVGPPASPYSGSHFSCNKLQPDTVAAIKKLLKDKSLSLQSVADTIGVSISTVIRMRQGRIWKEAA